MGLLGQWQEEVVKMHWELEVVLDLGGALLLHQEMLGSVIYCFYNLIIEK